MKNCVFRDFKGIFLLRFPIKTTLEKLRFPRATREIRLRQEGRWTSSWGKGKDSPASGIAL